MKDGKGILLVSIMLANNETGCVQPIKEICEYAKKINPDCIVHTDASQALGKIPVDVKELGVDLLTVAGHKIYGPKGIGALYIKNGIEKKMEKIMHGASHENNMRAGTENVLEIVGLGQACELISRDLMKRMRQFLLTRNIIYKVITEEIPKNNFILQGPEIDLDIDINKLTDDQILDLVKRERRLTNTLYISFPGIEANLILDKLSEKIACSAGAACHSEGVTMSHVLQAMKVSPDVAMGTLRISTGVLTTEKEAREGAKGIAEVVKQLMPKNKIETNNLLSFGKKMKKQ
jgi:cysteine sulfinate desulfinase/cysteine desulfurase-like protein